MLSLENLRYYCRTCLTKFGNICDTGNTKQFVKITEIPEVEQLICLCLGRKAGGDNEVTVEVYTPNICHLCADKWKKFVEHCQLAIRSDNTLRKLFGTELTGCNTHQTVINGNKFSEVFIETQPFDTSFVVEKYETTSPFFQDNNSDSSISSHALQEDHSNLLENTPIIEQNDAVISSDNKNSISVDNQDVVTERVENGSIRKRIKSKQEKNNTTRKPAKDSTKKFRYHCESCNKYFYEIQKYEGHVKQVHKGIPKAYQCLKCGKSYNSYKNLGHHIAENHALKSQVTPKCEECDKVFKTSVTLRQHMYHKHVAVKNNLKKSEESPSENKEQARTICEQCGFMAAHQYSLAQHIKNKHTEAQDFECQKCPKIFKSRYSLKYHILSNHTNIKPYQCSECQRTFTREGLLNVHKRTHIQYNERIKCDYEGCDVRFVKHGDKRHHVRLVHLKVKQHICEFCGEAFGALQTLRHHRFIHTGEKPYTCNVCGQGFRQRTAMKTHRKTHFGKESLERSTKTIDVKNLNENVQNILN